MKINPKIKSTLAGITVLAYSTLPLQANALTPEQEAINGKKMSPIITFLLKDKSPKPSIQVLGTGSKGDQGKYSFVESQDGNPSYTVLSNDSKELPKTDRNKTFNFQAIPKSEYKDGGCRDQDGNPIAQFETGEANKAICELISKTITIGTGADANLTHSSSADPVVNGLEGQVLNVADLFNTSLENAVVNVTPSSKDGYLFDHVESGTSNTGSVYDPLLGDGNVISGPLNIDVGTGGYVKITDEANPTDTVNVSGGSSVALKDVVPNFANNKSYRVEMVENFGNEPIDAKKNSGTLLNTLGMVVLPYTVDSNSNPNDQSINASFGPDEVVKFVFEEGGFGYANITCGNGYNEPIYPGETKFFGGENIFTTCQISPIIFPPSISFGVNNRVGTVSDINNIKPYPNTNDHYLKLY